MANLSASDYKNYLRVDKSKILISNSKKVTTNLVKDVLTLTDPMKLVLTGHSYFDYLFAKVLEHATIKIKGRSYQTFKAKIDKLYALKILDNDSYLFFVEINKLRNLFAHNIFFDITEWEPSKLPQVLKYKLNIPKRKDLLKDFSVAVIQTCYFTFCLDFIEQHDWLQLENVPKK